MGADLDIKQPDTASAVSSIVLSAGSPSVRDGTTGRTIVFSGRHEILATHLEHQSDNAGSRREAITGCSGESTPDGARETGAASAISRRVSRSQRIQADGKAIPCLECKLKETQSSLGIRRISHYMVCRCCSSKLSKPYHSSSCLTTTRCPRSSSGVHARPDENRC